MEEYWSQAVVYGGQEWMYSVREGKKGLSAFCIRKVMGKKGKVERYGVVEMGGVGNGVGGMVG